MWIHDRVFDRYTDVVKWRMTYECNYACPHCTQIVNHCAQRHGVDCDLGKTAAEINAFLRDTPTQILLIGGEPSILDLHTILEAFTKDVTFHMTTNFSRELGWYNSLVEKFPKFEVCCSFHDQHTEWAEFKEKFKGLRCEKRVEFCVTAENGGLIAKCAAECREEGIAYKVDYDVEGGADYDGYEKIPHNQFVRLSTSEGDFATKNDFVKTHAELVRRDDEAGGYLSKLISFRGLPCTAGQHSLYIIGNRIALCQMRDLTTADFRWRDEPKTCPAKWCGHLSCVPICVGARDSAGSGGDGEHGETRSGI